MAEQLALLTSDHGVAGSNPARGEILPELKRRFIAQSFSCSPFRCLEMTEILSKGRKTLTQPSIHSVSIKSYMDRCRTFEQTDRTSERKKGCLSGEKIDISAK